ncbi:TetR/AcrR family transcriptional regulator [Actinomycetaceae bacterium MB13-C1-2]|nr:TetR/AcrR family transcriptional regulator [Actinomycetaceae bacterium MB13-C1-2]
MGRPPKDAGPSATTRMEEAFFELLQQISFEKITVRMVVTTAAVNRNSFYYHYSNLTELARSAVENLLIPEIPRALASGFALDSEPFDRLLATRDGYTKMLSVLAVIGPNSTVELRDMLKEAVVDVWLEVFSLDRADLSEEAAYTYQFALGGIFELMGKNVRDNPIEDLRRMRGLPILNSCVRVVTHTLEEVSRQRLGQ